MSNHASGRQEERGDVAAGPPGHLAAEEHPLEVLAHEDARDTKAIGRQLSLARDLAEQGVAQEQVRDRERDEGHVRRQPRPRGADRPALDHEIVQTQRGHHDDRVLLAEEGTEKQDDRADVEPRRCARAASPAGIGQKRTEEEERRDRIDPAGDPDDAFGVQRQGGEHKGSEGRGGEAQADDRAGDSEHEQRVGGVERDVHHVVRNRGRRPPEGCQLIRDSGEGTNLVLGRTPDVIHPRGDEPSGEVERRLLREELHDAEVVVDEVIASRRHVGKAGREANRDDGEQVFRRELGRHRGQLWR